MNPHAYTEEQLVEQPAIGLFASLGWQTVAAMEETPGATAWAGILEARLGSSPTWPTNEIPLQKHCPGGVGFSPRQAVTRSRPLAQI